MDTNERVALVREEVKRRFGIHLSDIREAVGARSEMAGVRNYLVKEMGKRLMEHRRWPR